MSRSIGLLLMCWVSCVAPAFGLGPLIPGGTLSFAEMWERVEGEAPAINEARYAARGRAELVGYAGALSDPELVLEAENIGGSGAYEGTDALESTLSVSQRISLGDARGARRREAEADRDRARVQEEMTRLEQWENLVVAYAEALAATERIRIAEERLRIVDEVLRVAQERVAAGKVAPPEALRAAGRRVLAHTGVEQARDDHADAIRGIGALWRDPSLHDVRLTGSLDLILVNDPVRLVLPEISSTPEVRAADQELLCRMREWERARAETWPELEVGAGVRRFAEDGDHAWVGSVSLPLPLFDRNRTARRRAEMGAEEAAFAKMRRTLRLRYEGGHLGARMRSAWRDVKSIRESALPAASEALTAMRTGYEHGKFSYTDVAAAEEEWLELRLRLVSALVECHRAAAAFGRLSGNPESLKLFEMKEARIP